MTMLLIGFCFGTLFGLAIALVLIRHETRQDKRPGYLNNTHGRRRP